jgi:hypothetical protein
MEAWFIRRSGKAQTLEGYGGGSRRATDRRLGVAPVEELGPSRLATLDAPTSSGGDDYGLDIAFYGSC